MTQENWVVPQVAAQRVVLGVGGDDVDGIDADLVLPSWIDLLGVVHIGRRSGGRCDVWRGVVGRAFPNLGELGLGRGNSLSNYLRCAHHRIDGVEDLVPPVGDHAAELVPTTLAAL